MKFSTVALISLLGSTCFHSASAHVANPRPFRLYEENGDDLGLFRLKGGDINSWFEDLDGYTVCYRDGGSETRRRHLSQERAESVRTGEVVAGKNATSHYTWQYYYCRLHEDGTIGPNLHFPVATTDPNEVSDHLLPPHIHMSLQQAAEICGSYCQKSLKYGGSIPRDSGRRRELRGHRKLGDYAPSKGRVPNLVIPFKFKDHASRQLPSRADLDILMNSMEKNALAPTGGVKKYYHDISNGQLNLDSKVIDWIQLDGKYDERWCSGVDYPDQDKGMGVNMEECLERVLELTDKVVNFSEFETNNDGYIDAITFIHSGYDASVTGMKNHIWSHQGGLDIFTTNEGVKVSLYSVSPALYGSSGTKIGAIATIAHETAHFLGLEDLYDRDDGGVGVGAWSLMALDTGFGDGESYPPAMDPFSKEKLGWGTFNSLSESKNSIVLKPSYTSHQYYKITKGFPDGEYLLLENRQRIGFDAKIPGTGLLIWHIDTAKAKVPPKKEDAPLNDEEGHPGQPGWPQNNRHYMVALLAADGQFSFEKGEDSYGDATDLYGKCMGSDSIGPTTSHPNTNTYQGGSIKATGIKIKNIYQLKNNDMVFDICFGGCAPGEQVPSIECCKDDASWVDSGGDGCDKYEPSWCAEAKDFENDDGVSALTACCVCSGSRFGGPLPDTPGGAAPAADDAPAPVAGGTSTAPATSSCVDNSVWADSGGDKCSDYEVDWCGEDAKEFAVNGISGNTACCVCKGSCVDDTTWRDSEGDGCSSYEADWCGDDAVQFAKGGVHANMACCICKK
ncbi:unnamed protein product [Cylindrotheca closterium]|uniref:Peptidase M6-like domain-containing protein n=1 Tax=Cylindrotheca closterium TaxID=2856 RepID=A0AAD2PWV0_9STRA|nr:unnamed protein product [Cylindrotheca closterium]